MTFNSMTALFGAMFVLAIIPDASAFAVVARSVASGFLHGLVTTLGILVGDFIFILFAVYGLWSIAESMHNLFVLVKYLGAAYLISSGILLWKAESKSDEIEGIKELSWRSNFMCGLLITLGDPKAILFYMSFLPAFLDFSRVSVFDVGIIMAMVTIALGCVKGGYAFMGDKTRTLFQSPQARKMMNLTAGSVMVCTGIFLATKI